MFILYSILACSQKPKTIESAQETVEIETEQSIPDWVTEIPESGSLVQLIDPGEEPYYELRWVPTMGIEIPGKMEMTINIKVSPPTPIEHDISLMMDIISTVADNTINENFILSQTITGCTFKTESMEEPEFLSPLIGMTTNSEMTVLGQLVDLDYSIPEDVPEEFFDLLSEDSYINQMPNGFPQEKVGKGAKWRTLSLVHMQGTTLSQMAITTLSEFDGQKGIMDTTIEQVWVPSKQNQQVTTKTNQTSFEAITEFLSEVTSAGTLQASFDLHNPIYTEITMHIGQTMIMESTNGMKQSMKNSITVEITSPVPTP
jgi:hypothetical protein